MYQFVYSRNGYKGGKKVFIREKSEVGYKRPKLNRILNDDDQEQVSKVESFAKDISTFL